MDAKFEALNEHGMDAKFEALNEHGVNMGKAATHFSLQATGQARDGRWVNTVNTHVDRSGERSVKPGQDGSEPQRL